MLEARNISKRYGQTTALDKAGLSMRPGEIRALLGSNGSGKSTIAKILGGLVSMNSGDIAINGKSLSIHSAKDALANGIALAYQDYSLVDELTVEENLFLNKANVTKRGFIDHKRRNSHTLEVLERFHLAVTPHTLVKSLDESDKSLLEVAKALVFHPRYLILDEVTACLHRDQVLILFDILKDEKAKGLSILFISHRFDEVFELCDTVTIFRNGCTEYSSVLSNLTNDDIVFYMTGEREKACQYHTRIVNNTEDEPVLSIQHLCVGNQVVDVSLDLFPGEILGVCGLQGQGQGEFLRAIYGSKKITQGSIVYKGKKQLKLTPEISLKSGVAFISGDRDSEGIFSDRSIFENMNISRSALRFIFSGIRYKQSTSKAEKMIKMLNIVTGGMSQPASSLSGGNQQKLIFARNLLLDISVLILDDPTKGVDIHARKEIQEILRNLAAKGLACIYYSSDYKELAAISDRIAVFYEGTITKEFNNVCDEIESDLAAAMLGASKVEVI